MKFMKWHGAGNDFILMKASELDAPTLNQLPELAKQICHRHFGIGADGLMVVMASTLADFKMAYYNSDGSYAAMCGNGLRCFSAYCVHEGLINHTQFTVETGDGIKKVQVTQENGYQVTVNMGKAVFEPQVIPTTLTLTESETNLLSVDMEQFRVDVMRVGVPHAVVDLENRKFDLSDFKYYGTQIEQMQCFPEGTNVNFVKQVQGSELRVDTWERGAGLTMACGTGVCASAYSYFRRGLVSLPVQVEVAGGVLVIDVSDEYIVMSGPAKPVASGEFFVE